MDQQIDGRALVDGEVTEPGDASIGVGVCRDVSKGDYLMISAGQFECIQVDILLTRNDALELSNQIISTIMKEGI